ncbi:hypothetical protein [Streptomyces noursei]|uniref:hypothetical protein n=1 Tax=Streptomyces noursei TaxID=1971 RepID=UPI000F583637|nr:hypothetical protein [Streptomyces noursei]
MKKAKKDSGPTPNLSNVSPEAGLSTAAKLKPHKALEAMGGVGGAVDRTVGDDHKALAAAPPSMQRPAGAPQTLQGKPKADAPAQYDQSPAQKSDAPDADKAEVTGAKKPEGQIEAEKAEEPGGWQTFKMALGFGIGWVAEKLGFKVDKQELAAKFAGLPTKDEALKKAQAGNAPGVQMQGAAAAKADEQGGAVDAKGQDAVATGRDDAGRPMGEDQVYPNAPKEQLAAKVPSAQGGKGGGPQGAANTGAVPPEAASEVAEHDRGPQFQAAFSDGQKDMSKGRQKKDQDFRDSQEKHKKQVDSEIDGNTKSQADERRKAMSEVTDHRSDWRKEQDTELKKLGDKKSDRHDKVRKDVKDKEEKTDKDSTKEKEDGDKKIQDKNTQAENDAKKKRDDSVNESGNWLSKAFDWIKQKVIEIKDAIVGVIKKAREAVVGFITHFKETVERWINEARQFIADAIKTLINDLIEFAKAMVRAVIELALRIRKMIADLISAALALVNKLATMLKKALSDLLDAIGKILSGILDILKQVLDEAIKQVIGAIKAVLDFASKLLSALGDWMLIAVDFLSDPGGWLSGAKNSAVDGAKNHLFREISSAVKQWFKDKIQEIIGVPKAVLDKLLNGGFKLADIVKEAWDAVLPQLPLIIGELVMTKIVAKLIPGAGWVMAVIDAIRTAWGALSAILRALSMVLDWLKAVRAGGAGLLFAKAVAAGVVALLETLYQWLLNGIGKYVAKVGQRLKGVAARLGKGFGKEGRGPKGAAGEGSGGKGDRTGDKKPRSADAPSKEPAPKSAGAPATRPTTPKPHETRPSETRPGEKPGEKPGAGKPTPKPGETPERPAPGKPKSPADEPKKPTGNDKNGKPKTKADDKPDTRPTPAAKPKPEPEPRPKPKQDPEPKPKPKEDSSSKPTDKEPTKPNEKPGTKPKEDEPHPDKPNKPKEEDPTKPKPNKTDDHPRTPGDKHPGEDPKNPKNKPDKDHDPKKPKEGDNKKPKHKPDEKGPHKPKEDHPKDKDPGKKKDDKKDKKKEDENKKDSKDARLAKIVAKLRPRLQRMLHKGTKGPVHKTALASMRLWYRLTELNMLGSRAFEDEAVLNPRKMVVNGKEVDSEPILRYVRDMERMILNKAGQPGRTTGNELNGKTETGPSGSDRRHLDIPKLDIARVIALLKKEKTTTQIWNWGTEQIHRTRLGGWYLRKFRDGKTLPEQGEGTTTYADIEARILAAGAEGEASEALASAPGANRTLGPSHISSDIALHNSLSYFVERDRNPGNMVMSTLQTDLFAHSLNLSGDERRKWFRQVFGMNTMSPQGAPKGGTLLKKKKYLNNVGTIEKEIDTETRKAKNRGYSADILSDPIKIRADIERQISTEIAKLPENLQDDKKELRKVRNRVERSNKDLVKLESLHHGNSLAEREIRLIEEWVKLQVNDIDVSDSVTEEQVQEQLKAKIRERLEMRYPYIREVP